MDQKWEYLVAPLEEAAGLKKKSSGSRPERLNELGAAWPVVLLKRPVG